MIVSARVDAQELPAGETKPEPEAVFIVGVPRSGTTLMRMVLGKHSRIAIADENHFLGHFLPWVDAGFDFRRVGDIGSDEGVRDLVVNKNDLYILAGPTMDLDGPVAVFAWPGALDAADEMIMPRKGLRQVLEVPYEAGADHAEGMTFIGQDAARPSLMICYDSPAPQRIVAANQVRVDVFTLD